MEKNKKTFLILPTAPDCDEKGDDPQLYEPIIHHVLQKKKLVDSLKTNVLVNEHLECQEASRRGRDIGRRGAAIKGAKLCSVPRTPRGFWSG